MQALFEELQSFFSCFQPVVRKILRCGSPVVFGLFLSAAVCRLLTGTLGNFDKMLRISSELFICGKEMLGAVGITALLLQMFYIAYAYDHGESLNSNKK